MLKMCACPICVCVYAYEWKRSICYYVVFGCWYIYMYCDYDHISSSSTNVTAYEHAYTHVRPNKLSHRQFTSCTLCCNRLSVVVCRTLWSNKQHTNTQTLAAAAAAAAIHEEKVRNKRKHSQERARCVSKEKGEKMTTMTKVLNTELNIYTQMWTITNMQNCLNLFCFCVSVCLSVSLNYY